MFSSFISVPRYIKMIIAASPEESDNIVNWEKLATQNGIFQTSRQLMSGKSSDSETFTSGCDFEETPSESHAKSIHVCYKIEPEYFLGKWRWLEWKHLVSL